MENSTMIGWTFIVIGFITYSLALWGVGVNQPRTLSEEEKMADLTGNNVLYITSIVFVVVGLVIYIGASLYTGAKTSKYDVKSLTETIGSSVLSSNV